MLPVVTERERVFHELKDHEDQARNSSRPQRHDYERMQNPRRMPLAWFREAWDEQERLLGPDPWGYGLSTSNRKNLETLIRYAREQGMIKQHLKVDELFEPSVRGEEWKLPSSRG